MKAIVCSRYGSPDVLQVKELPKPVPADKEVLIKVRATTVTAGDWRVRSMDVPTGFRLLARLALGIRGPRQPILGTELAGEIEAVGKAVTRFQPGDPVFAFSDLRMGCHVEWKCMPEDGAVVAKPANLSYEEAASLSFGGTTALVYLRKAKIRRGDKVLVNGASGGVGTAAVQLAKHFGAHVTGVCSGGNFELVRSIGADALIDYTKEDFTKNGETYDIIVDTAGTAPFPRSKRSLAKGGRLLQIVAGLPDLLRAPWRSLTTDKKVIAGSLTASPDDVRFLAGLAEKGELKPVIDRRFPFEQIADAHRYVDAGHKKGNVVITLDHAR
jgi:NADPH:quinone reductase-like Zn-dependent oxidoreductase